MTLNEIPLVSLYLVLLRDVPDTAQRKFKLGLVGFSEIKITFSKQSEQFKLEG